MYKSCLEIIDIGISYSTSKKSPIELLIIIRKIDVLNNPSSVFSIFKGISNYENFKIESLRDKKKSLINSEQRNINELNYKCFREKKSGINNINSSTLDFSKAVSVSDSLYKKLELFFKENALYSAKKLHYSSELDSKIQYSYKIESNLIVKKSETLYDDKNIKLGINEKFMNFNDIKSFHYSSLTLYETSEIDNYIEFIYFIGCPKIKKNNFFTYCNNNYGYDDNRGNYIITIGDHIAYRYELCDIFGKESFGQVIKCFDHKIRFHIQALIEVKILKELYKWNPYNDYSFIKYMDHFYFRNIYALIFSIVDQMFREAIASKFKNILLYCQFKPDIKIIDFGSSCFENENDKISLEVILGLSCGISIDIWILGYEFEQLACIMEVLDLLEKSLIEKSPRKKIFFDSAGNPRFTVFSKGKQRFPFSKTLSQIIKCDDISLIFYLSVYYEIQNIV
ncbi:hypothetical protein PCK1_000046 [Pneumocystis canis]|nr:hypothetical protein PCK1_000046 [Pneumocystis canis]